MIGSISAVQALVLGALFAWAGIWKVAVPRARALAAQSALGKLLPRPGMAELAHLAVGTGEIVVAAALLLPPWRWWAIRLATLFALGFLGYLGLAWRLAPEKPCACMGGRATKISRRSLARAAAVLVLTLVGWPAQDYWGTALVRAPWVAVLILFELLALWALSPEFDSPSARVEHWLVRAVRQRIDPECRNVAPEWDVLERSLTRTVPFREMVRLVSRLGPSTDRWREGCWGYIAYDVRFDKRAATAVFAVPVRFDPLDVSAAVVDDADQSVLLQLASRRSRNAAGVANAPTSE